MSEGLRRWYEPPKEFVDEVVVETKKVAWPKTNEIVAGSISVIVVVAVIGTALGAVDAVLAIVMKNLLP